MMKLYFEKNTGMPVERTNCSQSTKIPASVSLVLFLKAFIPQVQENYTSVHGDMRKKSTTRV